MVNPMDLSGKTILITGASDGIGKAAAILLSQLGARIAMIARNRDKLQAVLEELEGESHKWYSYDLKGIEGIEGLVKTVVNDNGPLDGFVHSAGISAVRPLRLTTYEFIHDMMLVNFYSFLELTRSVSRRGRFGDSLSIAYISSIAATKGFKSQTAYSASKAAVDGAIRALSKELADKNIRINSIVSGMVRTKCMIISRKRQVKMITTNVLASTCWVYLSHLILRIQLRI